MLARTVLAPAIIVLSLTLSLRAHDIYSHLQDPWGRSCCDESDCRPVSYRLTSGHLEMLVDGHWIEVPDHTIQYRALPGDTGEVGRGHWCGFASKPSELDLGPIYTTRCAILPPRSASSQHAR